MRLRWLLLLLLCALPVRAQTDTPPPTSDRLGITFISSADVPHDETRYANARALGAGWNRWPLYWYSVQPDGAAFDWTAYDALVTEDLAHDLNINAILLGVPEPFRDDAATITGLSEPVFADGTDTPGPSKTINPDNPWAAFAFAAVERYKPGGTLAVEQGWAAGEGVRVWEVWNEPDFPLFWNGGVPTYARLLKVAYLAAHHADPDAIVMHGALTYTGAQGNWLARVLNLYLADPDVRANNYYLDAVAVHSYASQFRAGWLVLYARQTLAEFGLTRPIWLNESGAPVWDDYPGPTWASDDTEADARALRATQQQVAWLVVQGTARAWAEGAAVVFVHQLYDDCGDQAAGTDFPPHDGELCEAGGTCFGDAFGLYRNPTGAVCFAQHPRPGTARPAADSYRLLADVFGAAPFSARGVIEETLGGLTTVTFSRTEPTPQRITVAYTTGLTDLRYTPTAVGTRATLYRIGAAPESLAPDDGVYALELPAALPSNNPLALRDGEVAAIGGEPVIIVEDTDLQTLDALALLPATPAPTSTTEPGARFSDAQVEALQDRSPTGVVFVSTTIARVRARPVDGDVLGNLQPGATANVVGRLADDSWLQITFNGRRAWVAVFLGETYGDLSDVPVRRP